jgi:hypothetical protein
MKPAQGEVLVAFRIPLTTMLPTVRLDHNLVFKADEVHDPGTKRNLTAKFHMCEPPGTQQTPQHTFGVSRIAP